MPASQDRRSRTRAIAASAQKSQTAQRTYLGWATALAMLIVLALATGARAQESFPRIGISASKTAYVDHITVEFDTEFTLHAMVTGFAPGEPINQPVSVLPWVIHQVCCGAVLEILDIEYNPELQHSGHPLAGTVSTAEVCVDQDIIWLATLKVRMVATEAGDMLWAAGPFGPIQDCDGEVPFFMSMPVTITLDGEPTPTDISPWGEIKAMYR